jgi:hypothetical protein
MGAVASAASKVITSHRRHLNPLKNENHLTNDCQLNGQFFKIVAKWSEIET